MEIYIKQSWETLFTEQSKILSACAVSTLQSITTSQTVCEWLHLSEIMMEITRYS